VEGNKSDNCENKAAPVKGRVLAQQSVGQLSFWRHGVEWNGFYCYALAYGINSGLLDRQAYETTVMKAWTVLVGNIDLITAYRTAPHRDGAETKARVAQMLTDALKYGWKPHIEYVVIPILVPGEKSITEV